MRGKSKSKGRSSSRRGDSRSNTCDSARLIARLRRRNSKGKLRQARWRVRREGQQESSG